MHRLGGQKHGELDNQLALGTNRTQIEFATPCHDVVEHSIERELVLTRPLCHKSSNSRTIAPDKHRSRLRPMVPGIGGEQPHQITVVGCWHIESIESLLFSVVLTKRLREVVEGVDLLSTGEQRPLPGDFRHQLVDIFQLLQCRPSGVTRSPIRAGPEPHGKRFGEIFIWMALRVPESQVLDEMPAGRIRSIIARIALRGSTEQLLPSTTPLELIGVLQHMAGFMTKNAHAFRPSTALHIDDHFPLELHQAGVGQIERDSDSWRVFRAEPFARDPDMGPGPDAALLEFLMETAEARLKPGAVDRDLEVL